MGGREVGRRKEKGVEEETEEKGGWEKWRDRKGGKGRRRKREMGREEMREKGREEGGREKRRQNERERWME